MGTDELDKPSGVWCAHFKAGAGCRIYGAHARPAAPSGAFG